jgi:hypothetical protein
MQILQSLIVFIVTIAIEPIGDIPKKFESIDSTVFIMYGAVRQVLWQPKARQISSGGGTFIHCWKSNFLD